MELLRYYGETSARYEANGNLFLDEIQHTCEFEVGQLRDGKILLFCDISHPIGIKDHISRLEGTTREGFKVFAEGDFYYLGKIAHESAKSGRVEAFSLGGEGELSIQLIEGIEVNKVHFGVTNLELIDPKLESIRDSLDINIGTKISIRPVADYERALQRLRALKSVEVTCELLIDFANYGIQQLRSLVDDLCWILSVAKGTSVQWIYSYQYGDNGECISKSYFPRKTKPYCQLYIIVPISRDTKLYLEKAYPSYIEKRDSYRLNKGIIASYIDAKIETDYLEARGVKLVVAMEMLKDMFLELPDALIKDCIIGEDEFKGIHSALQKAIGEVLKSKPEIPKPSRGEIYKNILGLNHRSFRQILEKLCEKIDFKPSNDDLDLFITCRDSLVHTGRYYSQTAKPEERARRMPKSTALEEYLFLMNFMDKIFLKILCYNSEYYVNWSELPPRREILTE